ncbi:hypothetical protein [Streptomyces sp. NPDC001661]
MVTTLDRPSQTWSHLSDRKGWISNIYLTGGAWQDGIPDCATGNPPPV